MMIYAPAPQPYNPQWCYQMPNLYQNQHLLIPPTDEKTETEPINDNTVNVEKKIISYLALLMDQTKPMNKTIEAFSQSLEKAVVSSNKISIEKMDTVINQIHKSQTASERSTKHIEDEIHKLQSDYHRTLKEMQKKHKDDTSSLQSELLNLNRALHTEIVHLHDTIKQQQKQTETHLLSDSIWKQRIKTHYMDLSNTIYSLQQQQQSNHKQYIDQLQAQTRYNRQMQQILEDVSESITTRTYKPVLNIEEDLCDVYKPTNIDDGNTEQICVDIKAMNNNIATNNDVSTPHKAIDNDNTSQSIGRTDETGDGTASQMIIKLNKHKGSNITQTAPEIMASAPIDTTQNNTEDINNNGASKMDNNIDDKIEEKQNTENILASNIELKEYVELLTDDIGATNSNNNENDIGNHEAININENKDDIDALNRKDNEAMNINKNGDDIKAINVHNTSNDAHSTAAMCIERDKDEYETAKTVDDYKHKDEYGGEMMRHNKDVTTNVEEHNKHRNKNDKMRNKTADNKYVNKKKNRRNKGAHPKNNNKAEEVLENERVTLCTKPRNKADTETYATASGATEKRGIYYDKTEISQLKYDGSQLEHKQKQSPTSHNGYIKDAIYINGKVIDPQRCFISNIPEAFATESYLCSREMFGFYGTIRHINIKQTGDNKYSAWIKYDAIEANKRAIEHFQGYKLQKGRSLWVVPAYNTYCKYFINNNWCKDNGCFKLHHWVDIDATY